MVAKRIAVRHDCGYEDAAVTYAGGEPILPNDAWATLAAPRRLAIVRSLASLGTDADADFDRLTRLAATACAAPVTDRKSVV